MQGSGKTYEISGETTEWEDILISKGITTKEDVLLSKGLNPEDYLVKKDVDEDIDWDAEREARLQSANLDELDELDEDDEFADSRMLEVYRQRRIEEMKKSAVKNKFGEVQEIIKDEWIREVTEGSKSSPVVVHLYQDSNVECQLMDEALGNLAPRFRYLKFLRIKYDQAIENWPERNLPTVFVYVDGNLKTQIITAKSIGGKRMTAADVEWFLAKNGIITDSELEEDPRSSSQSTVINRGLTRSSYAAGEDSEDD
jgi:hypothetical protein